MAQTLQFQARTFTDEATGRAITQITHGPDFFYPLYYFIPTFTADGRDLILHRRFDNQIQMYRLDLQTLQAVQLTHATSPNALWRPWLQPPASGVRDQLSALNTVTNELIYFDGQSIQGVDIHTGRSRVITRLPEDRYACGLTGVSPDGQHFVFPHGPRALWDAQTADGKEPQRHAALDVHVDIINLQTGKQRTLVRLNSWITHTNFAGNDRVIFCHPPTQPGMLMTDLRGGHYVHLRTPDAHGHTSHYHATDIGIVYEMAHRLGVCDPATYQCIEYPIADYPVTHVGHDPSARRWFFDTREYDTTLKDHKGLRCLCYLPRLNQNEPNHPVKILSGKPTYGQNQVSHLHPVLMPDDHAIMVTFGDPASESTHVFLVDIKDLPVTQRD